MMPRGGVLPRREAQRARADELITAVHLPAHAGPQQFAKVGTRNAMVIAVCSFALALHPDGGGRRRRSARPPRPRAAPGRPRSSSPPSCPWDVAASRCRTP